MNIASPQPSNRLTDSELALWLKFIEHRVGFVLPNSQQHWIKGIIERYLSKLTLTHSQLFQRVAQDEVLFHQFFDEILIPRTQFFRHQATFDLVLEYAAGWKHQLYNRKGNDTQPAGGGLHQTLPSSPAPTVGQSIATPMAKGQPPTALEQSFVAWSVGSATGQEAVSLALTLSQAFMPVSRFWVWASDYHQQALGIARQGVYDFAELSFIPSQFHQWLDQKDERNFAITPMLLDRIGYFSFNLVQRQAVLPVLPKQCQVIMCQNVLIYFRQFEQRDILQFLSQYLADDGIVIMGVGEATNLTSQALIKIPNSQVDVLVKPHAPDWVKAVVAK